MTDVRQGALDGFSHTLALRASALGLFDATLSNLPAEASAALMIDVAVTVNSPSSFTVEGGDHAGSTYVLPKGGKFSGFYFNPDDAESTAAAWVQNGIDQDLTVVFSVFGVSNLWKEATVPTHQRFEGSLILPMLSTFTYSVDDGAPQTYERDVMSDEYTIDIELPAGTPLDSTVTVDLSQMGGIPYGYFFSNLENNRAEVALENGQGQVEIGLGPTEGFSDLSSYEIHFSVAQSEDRPSVWINGQRYDGDFSGEGMSLAYDEDGVPTLTLDGATIDKLGRPEVSEPVAGVSSCPGAIFSTGDLNVKLAGDSKINVGSDGENGFAIYAEGALDIYSTDALNPARLDVSYTHHSSYDLASVLHGDTVNINYAVLDVACQGGNSSADGTLVSVIDAKNGIGISGRGTVVTATCQEEGEQKWSFANSLAGTVGLGDATVNVSGKFGDVATSTDGDVELYGNLILTANLTGATSYAALFAPEGTLSLTGFGSMAAISLALDPQQQGDSGGGIGFPPQGVAYAQTLELDDTLEIVDPANYRIDTFEVPDYAASSGKTQGIVSIDNAGNATPAQTLEAYNPRNPAIFVGKTFDEVLPVESIAQTVWTDVLGYDGAYDPAHVLTADEVNAMKATRILTLVNVQGDDLTRCHFPRLFPNMENGRLTLAYDGVGDVTIEFPSMVLTAVSVQPGDAGNITLAGDAVMGRLEIGPCEGANPTMQRMAISGNLSIRTVSASDIASLQAFVVEGAAVADAVNLKDMAGLSAVDLSKDSALESIVVSGSPNLSSVALPEDAPLLTEVTLTGGKLSSIDLPDNAPLKNVDLSNNALTQLVLPETSQPASLNVANNQLSTVVIPEASRKTLEMLNLTGNPLSTLDLSGVNQNLSLKGMPSADNPAEITLLGITQADGTVVVDLSNIVAGAPSGAQEDMVTVSFGGEGGSYDPETSKVTFANADAAKQGFAYSVNTGFVTTDDAGDEVPVVLAVKVSVDVKPFGDSGSDTPIVPDNPNDDPNAGDGDHDDGSPDGAGSNAGNDGSSVSSDQDGSALAETGDGAGVILPIAVTAFALALVVAVLSGLKSRRKNDR